MVGEGWEDIRSHSRQASLETYRKTNACVPTPNRWTQWVHRTHMNQKNQQRIQKILWDDNEYNISSKIDFASRFPPRHFGLECPKSTSGVLKMDAQRSIYPQRVRKKSVGQLHGGPRTSIRRIWRRKVEIWRRNVAPRFAPKGRTTFRTEMSHHISHRNVAADFAPKCCSRFRTEMSQHLSCNV